MYVYYFNGRKSDNTLNGEVKVIEIDGKPKDIHFGGKDLWVVNLKGDIHGTTWTKVSKIEGEVYNRRFWLNELDYVKANEIIDCYEKERFMKKYAALMRSGLVTMDDTRSAFNLPSQKKQSL